MNSPAKYFVFLMMLLMGCKAATITQVGVIEPQEWSGILGKSTVWSRNILIRGSLLVPRGYSLTIQPGTVVLFQRDAEDRPGKLIVEGSLYAEGGEREDERIVLAAVHQSSREWEGIHFLQSATASRISYCRIFNANTGIRADTSDVLIEYVLITGCRTAGIVSNNASIRVEYSQLQKNHIGIECRGESSPVIAYNAILSNDQGVVCSDGARPEIRNNQIKSNLEEGIWVSPPAQPVIYSNNIMLNGGWAVYGGGKLSENFIQGNNQTEPFEIDTNTGRTSSQHYDVDEITSPRQVQVTDAGPYRRR